MMAYHVRLIVLILILVSSSSADKCDRRLDGRGEPANDFDGRFFITLWALNRTELVDTYMPNTRYIVSIEGEKPRDFKQQQKFIRFLLTVENKNESSNVAGTLDLFDEALTQFSDRCLNAVTETTQVLKETVNVVWISPPADSGCVLIRATVAESPRKWYMGGALQPVDPLTKEVCQDPKAAEDDPGPVLPECCACDEAKYEVTFEGLWSRNTHPKDFPSKGWLIRFSDVIGASHTVDYRFWKYNDTASEGLQQVAEFGSTRKLESELKDQSEHIRTIIKARGISHPNVTGRTFAVFRVDRKHHLMSLVSMIVPSPDWIVGVSGLELCLPNCSWIEHKELNLYPVDVGTDDGITYMSPDSPTDPPETIRRITSSWPNDTRSPFYDPLGADMKPMAKLHLNRQRLYEKICDDAQTINSGSDDDNNDDRGDERNEDKPKVPKACRTTRWSKFGPCSVTCGRGTRMKQRSYKDDRAAAAFGCNVELTKKEECMEVGPNCQGINGDGDGELPPECELTEWTDWSGCSTTCGDGHLTRSRKFKDKRQRKKCKVQFPNTQFQQTIDCQNSPCDDEGENAEENPEEDDNGEDMEEEEEEKMGEGEEDEDNGGEGDDDNGGEDDGEADEGEEEEDMEAEATERWLQKCPGEYHPWTSWTPCSSTCGSGFKQRSRIRIEGSSNEPLHCTQETVSCIANIRSCDITKSEAEEICHEPKPDGNCNPFDGSFTNQRVYYNVTANECQPFAYTGCNSQIRNNFDTVQACEKVCIDIRGEQEENFKGLKAGSQTTEELINGEKVDCEATEWSAWTPCRGCRGFTTRTRSILVNSRNGGRRCPKKLLNTRKCRNKIEHCRKKRPSRRRRYREHKSDWHFNEVPGDCQLTHWSAWSPCNATCGNATQHRSRRVKAPNGPSGKPCTKLVEFRKCAMIPCY